MLRSTVALLLTTALLTTAARAQNTRYIPDNLPSGGCNVIPFGNNVVNTTWSNQRYQVMATLADLGNPTAPIDICNIGFLACGTGDQISHHDTIVLQLGQTSASTLATTTFAANLVSNVQTVLQATDFQWKYVGSQWSRIGIQRPYRFDPALGNLVLDVCVTGTFKPLGAGSGLYTGSRQRVYNRSWPTSSGCPSTITSSGSTAAIKWCVDFGAWSTSENGLGCQGLDLAFSGTAELGQSLTIAAGGAPNSAGCTLVLGLQAFTPGLDLFGNGCRIYCNPILYVPGKTLTATVPNDRNLICRQIYTQFYCIDASYTGLIATSDRGLVIPGLPQ
ncbi:MAG: hypothetical protein H6836_06870 [Planctomycetes bacterium]|nr:hypothetical protein [Planctomycetota bacterium]MCB9889283.1 hypothetical protein [Planctomycetota bacterium]